MRWKGAPFQRRHFQAAAGARQSPRRAHLPFPKEALPIVEICTPEDAEFYDLSVKYIDPTDIHRIPARLPEDVYARAQELACRAHRALGCSGFSRSDFIVTADGPVILETNTIPGMTDTSLFPDEVRHAGMDFSDVCGQLIEMAIERHARR